MSEQALPLAVSTEAVLTFVASVAGSGVIAAILAGRQEWRKQLREQMLTASADFADGAVEVLAKSRYYRPIDPEAQPDRNEVLFRDRDERERRRQDVADALDRLRPIRGRVRIAFPGAVRSRSKEDGGRIRLPRFRPRAPDVVTYSELVIRNARKMFEISEAFWRDCENQPTARRRELTEEAHSRYQTAQRLAWRSLDRFALETRSRMRAPERLPPEAR